MVELTVILMAVGAIMYVITWAVLSVEANNNVISIMNFASIIALVIGILLATNKVQEVECSKCEIRKVVSANVKYCDICGSEVVPVNEK